MCTYSGGLGVLAGDTLKTFADFGFTAVGISLLAEKGYVEQEFDAKGKQISLPEPWNKEQYLSKLPFTIEIPFKDRTVTCAVWQYSINGKSGQKVPVYFLDTNLSENNDYDRTLTSHLYGGDSNYRLCQEYLLGAGGFSLLNKLGFSPEKVRGLKKCARPIKRSSNWSNQKLFLLRILQYPPVTIYSQNLTWEKPSRRCNSGFYRKRPMIMGT